MTEAGAQESKQTTGVLRLDKTIVDEVKKFAKDNGLTDKDAGDKIFFAKLAAIQGQEGSIDPDHDDGLTVFGLAAKYVKALPVIKALTLAANLKYKQKQIEFLDLKIAKFNEIQSAAVIKEVKVFCCPACAQQFATSAEVTGHFNALHEQTADTILKHVCPFCPTETPYDNKSDLQAHISAYHMPKPALNPPPSPIPPLQTPAKEVVKYVDVVQRLCLCGHRSKDATEQGQHLLQCPAIKQVVRA